MGEYYIINKDTRKVEFIRSDGGQIELAVSYPNKLLVPVSEDPDVRKAHTGCLYYDGVFWSKIRESKNSTDHITYRAFRQIFSEDELTKFDGFETDTDIKKKDKDVIRSMFKNLEAAGRVKKTDKIYANAAKRLYNIGYINKERYDSIKDILGEPDEQI